jgi:fructose-1,6-bisphosphatase/inositol monophosphatase family enzyme
MTIDNTQLLGFAKGMAHEAGKIMCTYFSRKDKGVEVKADKSPVTIADKAINRLLIDRVRQKYPDHGVLGEEASWHAGKSQLWVCDPIDGTVGFMNGIPTAMFSLAFVVDGQPVIAVAYNPFTDQLYTARKGEGAYLNDSPIQVSNNTLPGSSMVVGPSIFSIIEQAPLFNRLKQEGFTYFRPLYSGVFRHCLIAEGRSEGDIWGGNGAHDIAAVKLIVEEAGGRITDVDGNDQRYDGPIKGAIVSNGDPKVHQALVDCLAEYGAEKYLGRKR